MTSTDLAYAAPAAAAPTVESLGGMVDRQARTRLLVTGSIPLVISFGAQWMSYIAYWVPETSGVPGHDWWLTQFAPLAASGWWDVPALMLLLCSGAIYALCRTPRFWFGPAGLAVPAVVGTLVAVGELIALVVGGRPGHAWVSVLLLLTWVGTAAYATVHKIFDDPSGHAAPSLRESLIPLGVYAVIGTAPIAVGRMLFGRPLREVAVSLQENTLAGRLAALVTPTTLLLYVCGLLVGVAVWVAWEWWPPRRHLAAYITAIAILLGLTVAIGLPAGSMADRRAATLRTASPVESVHFSCGAIPLDDVPSGGAPGPVRTLVVTGFTCRTVTLFVGYQQAPSQIVSSSLAPLSARTPEDLAITSRLVSARYATTLIVAAGSRIDTAPDRLIWLDPVDGHQLGGDFRCGNGRSRPLFVRFARVPAGDDPALGHITRREKRPTVVVNCDGTTTLLDPAIPPPR